ncbi:VCBS repeat-containing protein [bacterium]|nr:VCBS repeat-containing protein [bacterium]
MRTKKIKRIRGSIIIRFCVIMFMLMIFSNGSSADKKPEFLISKLGIADKILDIHVEDLDLDGLKDILITHSKGLSPNESRWISIFYQNPSNGFSPAADQSWELDTLAVIMDTGDIIGDSKKEIVYFTSDEIRYYSITGLFYQTSSYVLFDIKGMMLAPSKANIPLVNCVRDWNDDGKDEIGAFKFDGFSIFSRDSAGCYISENRVSIKLDTQVGKSRIDNYGGFKTSGLTSSFSFPSINLIDYNNDGQRDLIVTKNDKLSVYLRGKDGNFSLLSEQWIDFDVRTKKEKIERTSFTRTTIDDINADGYADAIVTKQTAKGLTSLRGVLNIYLGKQGNYSVIPQQVIISEGTASVETMIRDVNGDGRLDLIMPSVKISITSIIRILLTRSIPINFNIFLLNEDGSFSDRPDFSKAVKLKIDFSGESDSPAMNLAGDFNGDKRKDFVYATDEDELSIYLGVVDDDKLFSDDAVVKVKINAFGELSSYDLNNDGYSDMIIRYPQNRDYEGMVSVLINLAHIE